MIHFIPHRLLVINEFDNQSESKILEMCMNLAFQWSNDMGMKGKKVSGLFLERPKASYDPLGGRGILWCKIECTEDEYKLWEEQVKLQTQIAVYHMLTE